MNKYHSLAVGGWREGPTDLKAVGGFCKRGGAVYK